MGFTTTPQSERIHIAIYGRRNAGKSTLINMLCAQDVSLVSAVAGTTTDPVTRAMELPSVGPVLFYDTAGFDDEGELGEQRTKRTRQVVEKSDLAILLFHDLAIEEELNWLRLLKEKQVPVLCLYNQQAGQADSFSQIKSKLPTELICVDVSDPTAREKLLTHITRQLPGEVNAPSIVGHLVRPLDVVLLVMPQDQQAPKGRLILPQVQTIRDLLDHQCVIQCCTLETLEQALAALQLAPALIITDSQVFQEVYAKKPPTSLLTSFSVLFARYKGDAATFVAGASKLAELGAHAKILIAEACTHAPIAEDIGRVKLPRMLRKRLGNDIQIDTVNGTDFPSDVTNYDLVIHCGACMFHKTYVMSRVEQVRAQGVAMSNYGIVIAWLQGILDKIEV